MEKTSSSKMDESPGPKVEKKPVAVLPPKTKVAFGQGKNAPAAKTR